MEADKKIFFARIWMNRNPDCHPMAHTLYMRITFMTHTSDIQAPQPSRQTLTAANDNANGATSIEMQLSSFVTIIAKAYVARSKECSA